MTSSYNTIVRYNRAYARALNSPFHTADLRQGELILCLQNTATGQCTTQTLITAGDTYGEQSVDTIMANLEARLAVSFPDISDYLAQTKDIEKDSDRVGVVLKMLTQHQEIPLLAPYVVLDYLAKTQQITMNRVRAIMVKFTPAHDVDGIRLQDTVTVTLYI